MAPETARLWEAKGVHLSDSCFGADADVDKEVHLLIGADYASNLLLHKQEARGRPETAWKTEIGWVLSGKATNQSKKCITASVAFVSTKQDEASIERLWKLEEPTLVSTERLMPVFPLRTTSEGYEVGLLWKSSERPDDNRQQAQAMALRLVDKVDRTGQRTAYDNVLLGEYRDLDAVEEEPKPEELGYYLPHHAVAREDAVMAKICVVLNASFASNGQKLLDDMVDAGPSLLPYMVRLPVHFREYPVAFQADIRKAFFMFAFKEDNRKCLRFLWPNDKEAMVTWRLKS